MPGVPPNLNDKIEKQYQGHIHISFGVETMEMVNEKLKELTNDGYKILKGPRKTGDGYWEFETLDPDDNRIEVSTIFCGIKCRQPSCQKLKNLHREPSDSELGEAKIRRTTENHREKSIYFVSLHNMKFSLW